MNYNIENYLDEKQLGLLLKDLYPNIDFVHNKQVSNSGIKSRPCYRSDKLMLIVEFDKAQHYQSASTIISDRTKDSIYSSMGYKIIRIPYFVQPTPVTIKYYFGIDNNITSNFKHGFISKNLILPCDFCNMGINRFLDEIEELSEIGLDDIILDSLYDKIQYNNVATIVFPTLFGYYTKKDSKLLESY